jgi:hypothetical protein
MRFFGPLSLAIVASAAFLSATPSRAAVVSISHDKLNECGRGFIFCNGRHAYSLSEIESGAIQIPVFPILPSEVVIVNDTGHTVSTLEFSLSTIQLFSFDVQCLIQSSAEQYFNSCKVGDSSSGFNGGFPGLFNQVSANFTFNAGDEGGIPDGAYFDITTVGFLPGGMLCGGGSGSGGGTNPGGGGSSGPPSQ